MPRALPMPPDERRAAIIAAAEPLLVAHGRQVSTRQLAAAAGVAEGTLFRVFANKDELVDATVASLLDVRSTVDQIATIDENLPLERRLTAVVAIIQARLERMSALFGSLGPDQHRHRPPDQDFIRKRREENALLTDGLVSLIGADADRLRIGAREAAMLLIALAFSGRHPVISESRQRHRPDEIVDLLLYGIVASPALGPLADPSFDEPSLDEFTAHEPALAGKDL